MVIFNWEQTSKRNTYPEYEYGLINTIISLNHLFDWTLKDEEIISESGKDNCLKLLNPYEPSDKIPRDFNPYYKKRTFPSTNPYQFTIRLLANKAKHFKKVPIVKGKKGPICSVSGTFGAGDDDSYSGYFTQYKYVVEINGRDEDVSDVISTTIDTWKKFFSDENNYLDKDFI